MKVLVVGATGRVGQAVVNDLVQKGDHVIAAARKENNIKITNPNLVTTLHLDLHNSVNEIAQLIGKPDAIIFTAGSRGKDLLQTDLNGAVKVMKAAEKNGVKRYVQLSTMYSLEPEKWSAIPEEEGLDDYYVAKYYSDEWLINNTNLEYTIIQADFLTESPATGKVAFGNTTLDKNSIFDVAQVLADTLDYDNTIDKVIPMHGGNTPIDTALKSI